MFAKVTEQIAQVPLKPEKNEIYFSIVKSQLIDFI
jgi:hypothetical protein